MSYEPRQETPLAPKGYFDDNDKRFRLCCCHVRTWALVIGVLELIGAVFSLISGIVGYTTGEDRRTYGSNTAGGLVWSIIEFGIWTIVASLLIYGVKKEKPWWLIPNIVFEILSIIGYIVYAIILFVAGSAYSRRRGNNDSTVAGVAFGSGAVLLLVVALEIFFVYAIIRCYKYLKEKVLALEAAAYVPMGSSYAAMEKRI